MTFKIHFECQDGTEDFFIISGDDVAEIRKSVDSELSKRDGKNPWSEEIM